MATKIASLYAEISADTTKLESSLKTSKSGLSGLNSAFQSVTGVSLSAAGAIGIVGSVLKASIQEAMDAEKQMAATNAVLKSTGDVSGMTADEVKDLAGSIQSLTGLQDDTVQAGENMLLTFTNIGNSVFPRATQSMTDMAVAMSSGNLDAVDLKGTAIQLGKALNDPITGITALSRVGVTFTDQQKKEIQSMMDMNDIAGAQGIILTELEREFGGMGKAMGETAAGDAAKLKNAISELEEKIGNKLLPVLKDAAEATLTLLTWQSSLDDTMQEHNKTMELVATSYQDYVVEMLRANGITSDQIDLEHQTIIAGASRGQSIEHVIEQLGLDTRAKYDNAHALEYLQQANANYVDQSNITLNNIDRATIALAKQTQAAEDLKNGTDAASLAIKAATVEEGRYAAGMSGELGKAQDYYIQQLDDINDQLAEVDGQISELTGKSYLTDDQETQLADLYAQQSSINDQLLQAGVNDKLATDQIMYDYAIKEIEADKQAGILTDIQAKQATDSVNAWAEAEGMLDSSTMAMYDTFQGYIDYIKINGPDAWMTFADYVAAHPITGSVNYTANFQYATTTQDQRIKVPYSAGGSFEIPMKYGYEGYNLGNGHTASGGETVTVTPAGQSSGGSQYILNIYTNAATEPIIQDFYQLKSMATPGV